MKIRDFAPQFTIYIFARDIDRGAGIKVALSQAGYDSYFFEDQDTLFSRMDEKPPHLLIFATSSLRDTLSDFVEKSLKVVPEVRFIVLAQPDQFETLAAYSNYGVVDLLEDHEHGLSLRAAFSVDRACESLYWQYQNEQLVEKTQSLKRHLDISKQEVARQQGRLDEKDAEIGRRGPPLADRVRQYLSAESKEAIVADWILSLRGKPCAYMQYLPTVRSLVVTHTTVPDGQGVGCHLTPAEAQDFAKQVALGFVPPTLAQLLAQAFQFSSVRLYPLFFQGGIEGLAAVPGDMATLAKAEFEDEFSIFSLAYGHFSLEKRVDLLEVRDSVTEVFNRKYGQDKIQEEWSRAKRIRQPLSLVKMALDDFYELEQALGETTRDHLLRNLAQLVQKSSRANDVIFRSANNELTMILPHCTRQGAMIRAERLRRMVESSQMLENGLKISISMGISEYPTLCSDPNSLVLNASKALAHILEKGGNKLCLSKAPIGHQPDFEVPVDSIEGSRGP